MLLYLNIGAWKLTVMYIILEHLHFQLILKTLLFSAVGAIIRSIDSQTY